VHKIGIFPTPRGHFSYSPELIHTVFHTLSTGYQHTYPPEFPFFSLTLNPFPVLSYLPSTLELSTIQRRPYYSDEL